MNTILYFLMAGMAIIVAGLMCRVAYNEGFEEGRKSGAKDIVNFMDHAVKAANNSIDWGKSDNENRTRKELDHEERTSTADDGDRDGDRSDMCDFG